MTYIIYMICIFNAYMYLISYLFIYLFIYYYLFSYLFYRILHEIDVINYVD